MPLYLTEDDVRKVLTMEVAVEAVEEAFRQFADGQAVNHPRARVGADGGALHFMAAASTGLGVMGTKTYGAVRGGGPDIRFYVQLISTTTGEVLAIIEASALGQVRTGAASGVATKYMAREDASTVGVIGSGYQAVTQLEAVSRVRDITSAKVFSRTAARREEFGEAMTSKLGIEVTPVDSGDACVEGADVVITITNSSRPVLLGEWLSPGAHINAAGSNHWMRRELDDQAIFRSDIIATDDVDQAKIECGELVHAIERGVKRWQQVRHLADMVSGTIPGRESDEQITLFESQGIALEDIAAGLRVYELAKEQGLGIVLPE